MGWINPTEMRIGNVILDNPFILAPLAGYSDLPFRLLCREYGAALCYSEMISCHGLVYRQQNTFNMLKTVAAERPVCIQLFGSEPETMGEAAAILSDYPIDLIDINMGCPVRKVIKKGAGAALMKEPQLAGEVIRRVCAKTTLPVTVKIRSGWSHDQITAPAFAKMAEEAGAAAVAIHARTWTDGFGGTVDRAVIKAVKQAVAIPVIGNGDISSYREGLAMMAETGCDAVMIGRGALGNPFVFRPESRPANAAGIVPALYRHLELIEEYYPPERVLARTKNQAGRYFKGLPGSSNIRQAIYNAQSFRALKDLLNSCR
ncbi:MAG: tRNA dihydrouridine synthase DusB [Desulfurivibrionaceae bacterium]|nr:tRNA dihydrouridine synthase DusB [Desulfurivibrionaceae bacterium]